MPDLALNGYNSPIHDNKQESYDQVVTSIEHDASNNGPEEPPLKKRKLAEGADSHKSSPRLPSPPWKKFVAEGPTSFVENGRRKSGRTNLVPLEQQPQTGRRQTRAHYDKKIDRLIKPIHVPNSTLKPEDENGHKMSTPDKGKRGPGRPPKVKLEDHNTVATKQVNSKGPRRHSSRMLQHQASVAKINGNLKSESSVTPEPVNISSPPLTLQRVKFRVALPKPSVMTPANIAAPKKYASFQEFLNNDMQEPYVGQETWTEQQVQQEASARHRVWEARRAGLLRHARRSNSLIDRQSEPPRQYAHQDHLLGHIIHFRTLLRQERKDHRRKAEQLAHEAKRYVEDKLKKGRVKTSDELAKEEFERTRSLYRTVVKDVARLWLAVEGEVNLTRLRQYEEERQATIKGHLNRVLERTDEMLQRQEDIDNDTDIDNSVEDSDDNSENTDEEDLSISTSESEAESGPDDPDIGLTTAELKAKYENIPNLPSLDHSEEERAENATSAADDSDPETEMDSEFDSDATSDEEEEEEGESDEEGTGGGLLSLLFSKKEITNLVPESNEDADMLSEAVESEEHAIDKHPLIEEITEDMTVIHGTDLDMTGGKDENELTATGAHDYELGTELMSIVLAEDGMSPGHSVQTSPPTSASKQTEPESVSSIEPRTNSQVPETPRDDKQTIKTPIPPLLRGTLREYQHEGLDWLANLYASGRSGILADEMGLGKTIQSISLLAHLASHYEVWGPHLIVVPTSVMLNWEMEFKKFLPGFKILTYYGNQEERKQKRRGWMADDSFNVCITSYQLVLQDANSFKRRKWHYMILDEAHNIKNFRSERWQTMMTFNTRARLLLTGTPLQNNLTELWSLLFFLHYGQEGQDNDDAFAGLKEWSEWFKRPVESILEHGRQVLDAEDKEQVAKLHKVIRPFLLRRLKADVEKQMPLKYEHVEMCRLSKRQRQLYDGFMSRAQTKETLASGNYLSIINALMQLRKVCNHPDLFETRPINTSFAMPKSVVADFEIQDLLVRRKMFGLDTMDKIDLDFLQLVPISNEKISSIENLETLRRHAYGPLKALRDSQSSRLRRNIVNTHDSRSSVILSLDSIGRKARLDDLDRTVYYEAYRHHQRPIYGRGLLQKLDFGTTYQQLSRLSTSVGKDNSWDRSPLFATLGLLQSIEGRSKYMEPFIQQYACVTPAVVANDLSSLTVMESRAIASHKEFAGHADPFHLARMKLSIAFPDKRLLQYDCGKLQRLDKLLRQLQSGGHRALIFTQMTKVLDILEQFLNIHGHRYLRLDGATKIEQRQILTDRFNNDNRILAFILSSRSGGLGINLTGADTVIFYDLDWNPAMDRQCTDRAHRIGQTRDVHIYRFVSEHTIESNILRKANQKQMLDDVVIQEGEFTTDYRQKVSYKDMLDETAEDDVAGAAMDRVLGNDKTAVTAFEQAEDREDVSAAKVAAKEIQHADEGDFEEKDSNTPITSQAQTPRPFGATDTAIVEADSFVHHVDDYLLKLQTYLLRDVPLIVPKDKSKRGRQKRDEHRRRRKR